MPEPMTAHARLQHEMDGIQAWVEAMPLMDGDDHMVMQPTDILLLGIPERTIPMPNQVRVAAFQHRNADVDASECFYDYANVLDEGPNTSTKPCVDPRIWIGVRVIVLIESFIGLLTWALWPHIIAACAWLRGCL